MAMQLGGPPGVVRAAVVWVGAVAGEDADALVLPPDPPHAASPNPTATDSAVTRAALRGLRIAVTPR